MKNPNEVIRSETPADGAYAAMQGPYIHTGNSVRSRMNDVSAALLCLLVWATVQFGTRVISLTLLSVLSAVLAELWACLLLRRPVTLTDGSTVTLGLTLACLLPVGCPLWFPVLGGALGTVIKLICGGLGRCPVNPALAARLVCGLLFPSCSNAFPAWGTRLGFFAPAVTDGVASPANALLSGTAAQNLSVGNAFLGNFSGMMGSVSALFILCGLCYLLLRRGTTWHIPVAYADVFFALAFLLSKTDDRMSFALLLLLCGGALFGAAFSATDSATSPVFSYAKLVYGLGCGALHFLLLYWGLGMAESLCLGVLIMNLISRPLDRALYAFFASGTGGAKTKAQS